MDILKNELSILSQLFYKSKNQFKSSQILNRLNEVRKKGHTFLKCNTNCNKEKLQNSCINLYISASSIFSMGHFSKFCLVIFGLSSRIYSILTGLVIEKDEIDDIFGEL